MSRIAVQLLKSFFQTADDLLQAELPRLGRVLLIHLNSWKEVGTVYQVPGGFNRQYCLDMMEGRTVGLGPPPQDGPEYGASQAEVSGAVREVFSWLAREGYLIHTAVQPHQEWFRLTRAEEELLRKAIRFEQWEKLGLD